MRDREDLLDEQLAYYRARAGEYDDWFFRRGQYDRGPEESARWLRELRDLGTALRKPNRAGTSWNWPAGLGGGRSSSWPERPGCSPWTHLRRCCASTVSA